MKLTVKGVMVSPMNFLVNSWISSTLIAEYLLLLPPIGNRPSYPKEVGEANPALFRVPIGKRMSLVKVVCLGKQMSLVKVVCPK